MIEFLNYSNCEIVIHVAVAQSASFFTLTIPSQSGQKAATDSIYSILC